MTQGARKVSIAGTLWTSTQVENIQLASEPVSTETPMESRIARLEADVAHLLIQVADLKHDLRSVRDRMEVRFDALFDSISALKDSVAGTRGDLTAEIAFQRRSRERLR